MGPSMLRGLLDNHHDLFTQGPVQSTGEPADGLQDGRTRYTHDQVPASRTTEADEQRLHQQRVEARLRERLLDGFRDRSSSQSSPQQQCVPQRDSASNPAPRTGWDMPTHNSLGAFPGFVGGGYAQGQPSQAWQPSPLWQASQASQPWQASQAWQPSQPWQPSQLWQAWQASQPWQAWQAGMAPNCVSSTFGQAPITAVVHHAPLMGGVYGSPFLPSYGLPFAPWGGMDNPLLSGGAGTALGLGLGGLASGVGAFLGSALAGLGGFGRFGGVGGFGGFGPFGGFDGNPWTFL